MKGPFDDLYVPLPKRFSASFIGATSQCMLKARFDRELGIGGEFATIGRAAHEVFATCCQRAQFAGLSQMDPDEAVAIARRVLTNPEEPMQMTYEMHQTVMEMVPRWAQRIVFPSDADVWVIEHPFRLPLVDHERNVVYTISGRMDQYAIWQRDRHYRNDDWKTGPGLPSKKEMLSHTQLPIYAWAAFQEHRYLETMELVEFYCRKGIPRTVELTRADIPDIEDWLIGRARVIVQAWQEGKWDANPSEKWCGNCPMPDRCPYPESVRLASVLDTEEQAVEHIKAAVVLNARRTQAIGAFRGYLEREGRDYLVVNGKRHGFIDKPRNTLNKKKLNGALAMIGLSTDDFTDADVTQEFGSRNA